MELDHYKDGYARGIEGLEPTGHLGTTLGQYVTWERAMTWQQGYMDGLGDGGYESLLEDYKIWWNLACVDVTVCYIRPSHFTYVRKLFHTDS